MKFSEMKKVAHNWLADQKLWMSTMVNPESINRDGDIAEGFIDALRLLGIYSANQAKEAYKELRAARDGAIKEAALGVGSTGSGKGDHPKMDDSLNHKFSLDGNLPDVKTGETYILSRHIGNGMGHFESAGEAAGLAVCCAATISGLAERLPRPFVIAAILSGCDHAGITMYELVATHEGAHIR